LIKQKFQGEIIIYFFHIHCKLRILQFCVCDDFVIKVYPFPKKSTNSQVRGIFSL